MGNNKRDYNIDLLKNIAIYLVIILHTMIIGFLSEKANVSTVLYYAGVFAIPLFFMISGYLHLQKENNYKYVLKKILKIILIAFFWNLIACLYLLLVEHKITNVFILTLKSFIQNGYFFHFWFLGAIIILYIMLPSLQKLIKKYKNTYKIMIIILFVLCINIDIINIYLNHKGYGTIKNNTIQTFRIWTWSLYYMLGGIMTKVNIKDIKKKKLYTITIIMTIITIIYSRLLSIPLYSNIYAENFYDSAIVIITTTLIFISIKSLNIKKEYYSNLLQYSMGIYILHPFLINILIKLNLLNNSCINILWSIIILLISGLITYLLSRIPLINKTIKI
ncbi:MAG: acyltransferase family protein [Bacilli bacterium]|nr:acyltransferase family protein [Bacilli bacterium]